METDEGARDRLRRNVQQHGETMNGKKGEIKWKDPTGSIVKRRFLKGIETYGIEFRGILWSSGIEKILMEFLVTISK